MRTVAAVIIGFCIDMLAGNPHSVPHPVMLIGKLITFLERTLRRICPKTPRGEQAAGMILWGIMAIVSTVTPPRCCCGCVKGSVCGCDWQLKV